MGTGDDAVVCCLIADVSRATATTTDPQHAEVYGIARRAFGLCLTCQCLCPIQPVPIAWWRGELLAGDLPAPNDFGPDCRNRGVGGLGISRAAN